MTASAFHYLMDLHYSQTSSCFGASTASFTTLWIYTILKQACHLVTQRLVSLPYGFTLFSNMSSTQYTLSKVSLPYGFTLFSNPPPVSVVPVTVSLPYGFTLFSNELNPTTLATMFHYLMDLHYSQTKGVCTAIKNKFHYLMDLHYSQTCGVIVGGG